MKTSHQQLVEELSYKHLHAAIDPICEQLISKRHNAKYKVEDFVDSATFIAASNTHVGTAMTRLHRRNESVEVDIPGWNPASEYVPPPLNMTFPTPQWFLHRLHKSIPDQLFEIGTDILNETVMFAKQHGLLPKHVVMAVDAHDIPCHTPMDNTVMRRSKPKGGTSKKESYITMQVVDNVRITTAVSPYTANDSVAEILSNMIHDIIQMEIFIKKLILDRGFHSVATLQMLHKLNIPYIMAVPASKPIKDLITAYHNGHGDALVPYTVRREDQTQDIQLLIHKRKDADKHENITDKYIVLAYNGCSKNIKRILKDIPEEYSQRWGIETGYRNIGNMRAKTRSKNFGIRQFLFLFSTALSNIWSITNQLVRGVKYGTTIPIITIDIFRHCLKQIVVNMMARKYIGDTDPPPSSVYYICV